MPIRAPSGRAVSVPDRILGISKNHYYYIDGLVKCFFWDFGSGKSGFVGLAFSFFAGTAMKRDFGAPEAGIAKDFARDKARLCID